MLSYIEDLGIEGKKKERQRLQNAWAKTVQDVLRKFPTDLFGEHPELDLKEGVYALCPVGISIDIPITGTKPHILHFRGKREVTGRANIRGGKDVVEIFLVNKEIMLGNTVPGRGGIVATAIVLNPTPEKVMRQLLDISKLETDKPEPTNTRSKKCWVTRVLKRL